jgi:molecular chaperone DnaK
MLRNFNENFGNYSWKDSNKARQLINSGISKISENPDAEELRQILISLFNLLPQDEVPSGDNNVLVG